MLQVLIVDDDPYIREMISNMLTSENYLVLKATDGNSAMQIVKNNPTIDIVITDLIMPEKEGIETIRELKENFSQIKILAISGGGKLNAENYLILAKGMGADEILKKPFVKKDLLLALNRIIDGTN